MEIKKHSVEVNGINIIIYESFPAKSKIPVVLLHGGGLDSAMLSYRSIITILGEIIMLLLQIYRLW